MDPVVNPRNVPADMFQRAAGIVADLIFGKDTPFNLRHKGSERLQLIKIDVQTVRRILLGIMPAVRFHTGGVRQETADPQQFRDAKSASDLQTLHGLFHRGSVAERDPAFLYDACVCGSSLLLKGIDLFNIRYGL